MTLAEPKKPEQDHVVRLLTSGETFFEALEQAVDQATEEIHFQTYILKWDQTGKRLLSALGRASARGVHVRLLLDAYGSNGLSAEHLREYLGPEAEFRFFGPLFSEGRFHIGRRLHHKVAVFDRTVAIVGGINISDVYRGSETSAPWFDFAVILEGRAANILRLHCERIWQGGQKRFRRLIGGTRRSFKRSTRSGAARVRPVRNDFLRSRYEAAATYRRAFRSAKHSIDMVSGYFLPGRRVRRLMKRAVRRGVRIRVILSEKSDVRLARLAREYLYGWMLKNGIEVYEYNPSNVHGKVLSVDGLLTSVGSYDLNNLSTYSNIEMNVNVLDEVMNSEFTTIFEKNLSESCTRMSAETLRSRSGPLRKIACWAAYRLTKTLFGLSYLVAGEAEKG